ncbi:hypothetical protein RQP46_008776 [Phenoliferia psychrophenolica]
MREAISVLRANLISLGVCLAKFSKSDKFRLRITVLHIMGRYAKNKGKFKRGFENAQEVLQLDESNQPEAKFREAQARTGVGQCSMGKILLEELQESPDSAIDAELKKLAATALFSHTSHNFFLTRLARAGSFSWRTPVWNGLPSKPSGASAP